MSDGSMNRIDNGLVTISLEKVKNYFLVTKPGIIMGNLIPAMGAFFLGLQQDFSFSFFFLTILSISLIIASACVFNNMIDKKADQMMERTQNRPLPKERLSSQEALVFGVILFILGSLIFLYLGIMLSFLTTLIGFFVYVFFYSFGKYRTHHATLIGAIAGATPFVAGYFATDPSLNKTAFLLFFFLFFWQMPHFISISLYRMQDYAKASFPILPLEKGILRAKYESFFYAVAFLISSFFLVEHLNLSFGLQMVMLLMTSGWVVMAALGFGAKKEMAWAKGMFRYSLLLITFSSLLFAFS